MAQFLTQYTSRQVAVICTNISNKDRQGWLLRKKRQRREVKATFRSQLITSRQKLHDKVEVQFILKTIEHFHNPQTVCFHQNVPFCTNMAHLEMHAFNQLQALHFIRLIFFSPHRSKLLQKRKYQPPPPPKKMSNFQQQELKHHCISIFVGRKYYIKLKTSQNP